MKRSPRILITTLCLFALCGCEISAPGSRPWLLSETTEPTAEELPAAISELLTSNRQAGAPYYTPTPDSPHALPTVRSDALEYTVQSGDYLSLIASNYSNYLDPETMGNPYAQPIPKSFIFGVNVNF